MAILNIHPNSTKNGKSVDDNIVRETSSSVLTSHVGLNPSPKPENTGPPRSPDEQPAVAACKKKKQRQKKQTEKKRKAKKKKKKQNKLPPILRLLLKITVLAGIITAVLTWVLGLHRMTGNNMFPFIKDGDLCILYKLEEYTTGDVVAYRNEKGTVRIGRIVAVAGQDVDFPEEGGYTVDGYQPTEEITYQTFGAEGAKYPAHVGEGQFFVMNDFRSDTDDSRKNGAINASQVCGKLMFLIRRRGF